ncbi:LysM peptidoglycan-binding domain-containing protein [Dehalobacter sp. DCM]|uniref:LysM peptidoglycan-binding domain-containing protein n=1 Tax=Dehalobacter sp. DCM TaxID=2907827 RepID=UPI0030819623|nr:LysM peptidoglycan-binding domain-containing protein [Dehalobacter sp. DCM]
MYFGRKSGNMNQPAMAGMMQPEMMGMNEPDMMGMNQPEMMTGQAPGMPYENYQYEQMTPEGMYSAQTQAGYACVPCDPCDPCGCVPYDEHHEHHKPLPEIYVVQKGDSVYKIAQRYGLDWRELAGYNHLGNPDLIYPGERLFIPPR